MRRTNIFAFRYVFVKTAIGPPIALVPIRGLAIDIATLNPILATMNVDHHKFILHTLFYCTDTEQ